MSTIAGNITEFYPITDWRVTAIKALDGSLGSTGVVSGSSYSLTVGNTEPHIVTIQPKIDYKWSASKIVVTNDYCIPTNLSSYPYLLKATTTGDDSYSSTTLLCKFEGSDNSTTFTDLSTSNITLTAQSGAKILNTAPTKFGGYLSLNGTSDYVSLSNNAAINNFGTGDYTIEAWVYCTDVAAERVIIGCYSAWTTSVAYLLEIRSSGDVRYYAGNSVPIQIFSGTGVLANNTWTHIAVSKSGGTTKLFVGGTSRGTPDTTHSATTISNSSSPIIGKDPTVSSAYWKGNIDSIRITKGLGRYTNDFTAPTIDFQTSKTGTVEPTWPSSGTQSDGDITWTIVGNLITPVSRLAIPS